MNLRKDHSLDKKACEAFFSLFLNQVGFLNYHCDAEIWVLKPFVIAFRHLILSSPKYHSVVGQVEKQSTLGGERRYD